MGGGSEQLKEINSLVNKKKLNISSDEELFHVMHIITSVTFHNFVEKFAKDLSYEKAINNYAFEIKLLKNGLYKKDE